MMDKKLKKGLSVFLTAAMTVGMLPVEPVAAEENVSAQVETQKIQLTDEQVASYNSDNSKKRTSVHDPSVVAADGEYYIFGSHMGEAKTTDLMNWTGLTSENDEKSTMFGDANGNPISFNEAFVKNNYTGKVTVSDKKGGTYELDFGEYNVKEWMADNTVSGNMWAPDVIYNDTMKKWCMYLSLNGADWNSSIILLTADKVDGTYVYQGPVVFSGFSDKKSYKDTDLELVIGETDALPAKYEKLKGSTRSWGDFWPHAIDPCVFYDEEGKLWMSYGSWSGGIYMLELDETTGLRDYTIDYASDYDEKGKSVTTDEYFGTKVAGGYYVSGEGSYIQHIDDYYYMFISYGFYSPEGGYNMRVFRSETPDGPYVDGEGNSAIFDKYENNYTGDKATRGMKIIGNYKWNTMNKAEIAQGHNSAITDSEGKSYVVYHTKFDDGTAGHEIRVHQLFTNEDGWLVAAPYEYSGETLSKTAYDMSELVGNYDVIVHNFQENYAKLAYEAPVTITLNADGTISGEYEGTWSQSEDSADVTMNIAGNTYKGVFVEQTIDGTGIRTMCFTIMDAQGLAIWGSHEPSDAAIVAQNAASSKVSLPKSTYTDITLAGEGLYGAKIHWESSNEAVISTEGKVTQQQVDTDVTLKMVIEKGDYYYGKNYNVTVKANDQNDKDTILVGSYFENEKVDISKATDGSVKVANPFYKGQINGLDLSGGVSVEFDVESTGKLNVLGTILAFSSQAGGKLYFTPGSYLGYNAEGLYYDANLNNYALVKDYIGKGGHVKLNFTDEGFELYVNGEKCYDQTILDTENGAGTVKKYSTVLKWLYNSADTLNFGTGSWWEDNANVTISNVKCYVGPVKEQKEEVEKYDEISYEKESVVLETNGDYTEEANPFYNKNLDNLNIEYTINWAENAAKNGWDGIFAFYDTASAGRVSIQTAPYICYNGGGSWMDINQPAIEGADVVALRADKGVDHKVEIHLTRTGLEMTFDGEPVDYKTNSSGADFENVLEYVTQCNVLTWGVGIAKSSYWNTELCTLRDIKIYSTAPKTVEPEEPEKPADPEGPTEPEKPADPEGPVTPEKPVKPVDKKVKATSVKLNKTSVKLQKGKNTTLKATILPKNTTDKTLKWTTSDKKVATVNASGVVTAKTVGKATITVETKDGSKLKAKCTVNVIDLKKKGATFADKTTSLKYKVTKADAEKGTVECYGYTGKSTTVTIPKTVKVNGVTYKVTAVSKNAFKNNTKIKKVTIGENVTKIGSGAFYGCKALKTVNIKTKALAAKSIGSKAFASINPKAKITVPSGKKKAYSRLLKEAGLSKTAKIA